MQRTSQKGRRQVKAQVTRTPQWAPGLAGHLRHQRPGRGAVVTAPAGGRGRGKVKLGGGTRPSAPLQLLVGQDSFTKTCSRFCSQRWISMHVGALLPVPHLPPRLHGHAANPGLACSDTWWTSQAVPAPGQAASIGQTEPWAEKGGLKEISSRMRPEREGGNGLVRVSMNSNTGPGVPQTRPCRPLP